MIGFMGLYVLVMLYFALRSKFINVERQEIEAEAPNNVVQLEMIYITKIALNLW